MTRSKVVIKKHFKTKLEFTGSGSLLNLKKCSFRLQTLQKCFNSLNMMVAITLKLLIEP